MQASASDGAHFILLSRRARTSDGLLRRGSADVILRSPNYEFLTYEVLDQPIATFARRLSLGRSVSEQRRIAETLIDSADPEAVLGISTLDVGDPLLMRLAADLGVPGTNSVDVAEAMAVRANQTGSWSILDNALNDSTVVGATIRSDLSVHARRRHLNCSLLRISFARSEIEIVGRVVVEHS